MLCCLQSSRNEWDPQIRDQAEQISRLKGDAALLDSGLQDAQRAAAGLTARLQVRLKRRGGHRRHWRACGGRGPAGRPLACCEGAAAATHAVWDLLGAS